MPGVNDLAFLPHGVFADFFWYKILEHFVQPVHELRARRDAIGVKTRLFGQLLALRLRSHLQLFGLNSRSESKSTRDLFHNFLFIFYYYYYFFFFFFFFFFFEGLYFQENCSPQKYAVKSTKFEKLNNYLGYRALEHWNEKVKYTAA